MTSLARKPFPPSVVPLIRQSELHRFTELQRGEFRRKPARRTANSGPTKTVRQMVLERDGFSCVCCGISILGRRYSLGHRLRASHGGKPVASNLITLLGWGGEEHHGRIDLYEDPADEAKGYRIRSGVGPEHDPHLVPVTLFNGPAVWLDDLGHYLTEPPMDVAS